MLPLYFYPLTFLFVWVACGCYSSEESLVVIASLVLSFPPPLTRGATTFRFCNCVCVCMCICVCFCICNNIALCVSSSSMQCSLYLTPSASFGFTLYLYSSCTYCPTTFIGPYLEAPKLHWNNSLKRVR